ncbi:MAG: UDP-N-acetylmuramate dehydrogenase [Phycisphaerae bacterium]
MLESSPTTWCSDWEAICRPDAPLREHTWYRLGGPARWLLAPRDEHELAAILARCRESEIPVRILGHGANLLVRDEGVNGAVIVLRGPAFEYAEFSADRIVAAAGADFPLLVKRACSRGLSGLELLAGIPGSLGGIIRMNAGGRHGEIAAAVDRVRFIDREGVFRESAAREIGFRYRHTNLDGCVIVGATLRAGRGAPEELLTRFREIWSEKYATQPAVSERSAGCIFKNPPGHSAGALVDRAGLKGRRAGAAEISRKHANFIVAHDGAQAADVVKLIELAQEEVWRQFSIRLETEVEIW